MTRAAILIAHAGLDTGARWRFVANRLTKRFRVIRIHRRQYRLDLSDQLPCTMAQEAEDLVAAARSVGEPVLLVGHSSGGVASLEALVRAPEAFSGAVLYEPPVHLRPNEWGAQLARARAASGVRAKITIFSRDIVGLPALTSHLIGLAVAAIPPMRALAPHQIDDAAAINDLGVRLDAYAHIETPCVLLGGDRSPAHLGERLAALAKAFPRSRTVTLKGQGHGANVRAPGVVAQAIAAAYRENASPA